MVTFIPQVGSISKPCAHTHIFTLTHAHMHAGGRRHYSCNFACCDYQLFKPWGYYTRYPVTYYSYLHEKLSSMVSVSCSIAAQSGVNWTVSVSSKLCWNFEATILKLCMDYIGTETLNDLHWNFKWMSLNFQGTSETTELLLVAHDHEGYLVSKSGIQDLFLVVKTYVGVRAVRY